MTTQSALDGSRADEFAAIERLRATRVGRAATGRGDQATVERLIAGLQQSDHPDIPSGSARARAGLFAAGAALTIAVALAGLVVFPQLSHVGRFTEPRAVPARTAAIVPDEHARQKLAVAMRAVAAGAAAAPVDAKAPVSPSLSSAERADLEQKARALIDDGNIAAARALLARGARIEDAGALFALAQTFDPKMLQRWKTVGLPGDAVQARDLYRRAAAAGSNEARRSLEETASEAPRP
ncbi:MAG: hypothetical protein KGM42_08510 [Hyphomicrobiales bacterium]|nr:hypothetical protein [Hyphomicrobiales bacterium]